MMLFQIVSIAFLISVGTSDFVYEQSFPDRVKRCFGDAKNEPVDMEIAKQACVMAYYSEIAKPRNLTEQDKAFFQKRVDDRFGMVPPVTGFRLRREIRTLSKEERGRFFSVLHKMYKEGILNRFGRLHGQTGKKVHKGAAFLPWHRVFILDFEEEMRRIDNKAFLPYWDYTIDNNITKPSDSVVWSDCFFGNGEGFVQSGPFKNWYGGHSIQLRRDYAAGGQCPPRLINKMDVENVLQQCYFKDVTTGSAPYFGNLHNIELLHDGVHDWVGGDMDELPFSAFDPVFYMHHAFIDLIWERFRHHQYTECNVNPENDWRPDDDLCQKNRESHGPLDTMFGYRHLHNIDGSWNNWTHVFYNYEEPPSCPHCGHSEFLYCDRSADPRYPKGLCLTKTKYACNSKGEPSKFTDEMRIQIDDQPDKPSFQILAFGELLKGVNGDGRSRDMSLTESRNILRAEIAKGRLCNATENELNPERTTTKIRLPYNDSRSNTIGDSNAGGSTDGGGIGISLSACAEGYIGLGVAAIAIAALLITAVVALLIVQRRPVRVLINDQ